MMPLRAAVLLFLAAAVLPSAVAQAKGAVAPPPEAPYGDFSPSMAIVIVVIVSAFFFMGFFTIYVRHCVEVTGVATQNRFYASVHLRLNDRGLDPEIIDSFPIFHYSDVKEHKIGKGVLECAVCICEFEDDDPLRLLPKCDHAFHPECIDAWLSSHATCPVCRANLKPMPEETDGNDQGAESVHSTAAAVEEQISRSEIGETQNQISITVDDDQSRDPEAIETPTPKQNQNGGFKFPRSNSTGHSLVEPGECCERYTLRLPEELRTHILSRRLKRTTSCIIVCPADDGSRRGNQTGSGEGSNRGRLPEWLFSRTPPFLSRNRGFMMSPKRVFDGDTGPSKLCLTSVITPFDCLAVKGDGVGQTSFHPQV